MAWPAKAFQLILDLVKRWWLDGFAACMVNGHQWLAKKSYCSSGGRWHVLHLPVHVADAGHRYLSDSINQMADEIEESRLDAGPLM